MNIINHFKTICIHKYNVFIYCFNCGIIWRGLVHDLSKFSFIEFFESVKYYTGTSSPIDKCKKENGYSLAWFHHRSHNKHHYEYWIDNLDKGGIPVLMPYKYAVEQLCDWLGAGKTYLKHNFSFNYELKWLIDKLTKHNAKIDDITKSFSLKIFTDLAVSEYYCKGYKCILNKKYLKESYDEICNHSGYLKSYEDYLRRAKMNILELDAMSERGDRMV